VTPHKILRMILTVVLLASINNKGCPTLLQYRVYLYTGRIHLLCSWENDEGDLRWCREFGRRSLPHSRLSTRVVFTFPSWASRRAWAISSLGWTIFITDSYGLCEDSMDMLFQVGQELDWRSPRCPWHTYIHVISPTPATHKSVQRRACCLGYEGNSSRLNDPFLQGAIVFVSEATSCRKALVSTTR
jgi:hypothetical protein